MSWSSMSGSSMSWSSMSGSSMSGSSTSTWSGSAGSSVYNEVARRLTDVMYVTHDDDECVCPPVKADDDWTPEPTLHPTPQPGDPTMKPTRAPTAAPTEVPVDLKIDASTTFNNFNCDTFDVVKSAFKKTTKISLAGGDDDLLSAISVSIEGCTDGTEEEESSRRARKLTETSAEIAWSAGVEDVQLLGKGNVDELFEDMEKEYDNAVDSGAFQETFEDEAESEGEDAVQAIAAISGIAVDSFEEIVVVHSASPTRAPTRKKKSSDDDDGVDEGAQAGIGVGSAFGALFFFAVVYYFKKRYDEKGAPSLLSQDYGVGSSTGGSGPSMSRAEAHNNRISNRMSHKPTNWPTQGGSAAGTNSESSVISPVTNDWKEHQSTDGRTYYHSKSRNSSVWTKPAEFISADTFAEPSAVMQPTAKPDIGDATASSVSPYPNDWVVATSPQGLPYYYSASRNESTWTKPEDFIDPAESSVATGSFTVDDDGEIRPSETSFTSTGSSVSKNKKVRPENETPEERAARKARNAARKAAAKAGESSATGGPDVSY